MSDGLARVIAVAIEQARMLDEERVRAIVREEIAKGAPPVDAWLTPPRAAQSEGVGLKRVRALIAAGTVEVRSRNLDPNCARQQKLEVRLSSLRTALRGAAPKAEKQSGDAVSFAARVLARRGA